MTMRTWERLVIALLTLGVLFGALVLVALLALIWMPGAPNLMAADLGLILFGIAVGWVLRWAFTPPCPKYEPKYWVRSKK